ncbi:MAG: rod shape-determining protein MreC [Bradymonadaceae bacterium]|nr:rod shape-determining protein MreC [Lujinxingiaceae bacterium]
MFELLRNHRRKAAGLILVVMPFVLMATSAGASIGESPSHLPMQWMQRGVGWAQYGGTLGVGGLGGLWARITSAELVEENRRLKHEVARLREEKSRLIGILQENSRLREMVDLQKRHPEYELVPAMVIGRDVSPYFRVVTIKIQSNAKLKARMPVIAAGGVVGQIHRVYGEFADVVVLSDPRSRIDAISQRNRTQGVVQGLGHERDYFAKIAYLLQKDEIRAGDVMVTSGMGGIFPKELIIGTVTEIGTSERGLFQEASIEPAVDFSRLEEVFVIMGSH